MSSHLFVNIRISINLLLSSKPRRRWSSLQYLRSNRFANFATQEYLQLALGPRHACWGTHLACATTPNPCQTLPTHLQLQPLDAKILRSKLKLSPILQMLQQQLHFLQRQFCSYGHHQCSVDAHLFGLHAVAWKSEASWTTVVAVVVDVDGNWLLLLFQGHQLVHQLVGQWGWFVAGTTGCWLLSTNHCWEFHLLVRSWPRRFLRWFREVKWNGFYWSWWHWL